MKIVLILMVKNEEKIIQRCLEAVEGVVDAFCITDTGSSDTTVELANEFLVGRVGCVNTCEWKNFGHNRTISFQNAQAFVKSKNWDLKNTYGLLLDADMMFISGSLLDQTLGGLGYTVVQNNGNLEYPNTRLVRMDYDWVCKGVTHEYWDGECTPLSRDICRIDDRNDGGCKADKFTRDLALLEGGLEEDPTSVRYMFYLAQTHHGLGNWEKAIEWYKRRIEAGGWFEEVWYSYYMISKTYEVLKNYRASEEWVLKAYDFHPGRAEAIYHLVKQLRCNGDHYKAMHYIQMGKRIPHSKDALFIENDIYTGLFDYEETICRFYTMSSRHESLVHSITYLMKKTHNLENVYNNLQFYIDPIAKDAKPLAIHRHLFGPNFHPTAISVCGNYHNIRYVNYNLNHTNTTYTMKNGLYSENNTVETNNACYNVSTGEMVLMKDETVTLPRRKTHVNGLEDVRIYRNAKGELCFLATAGEYSDRLSIIRGHYNPDTASYSDCVVMESPTNAGCEKNWLPISGTDNAIYFWHPLQIGKFVDSKLVLHTTHKTPWFFKNLRGSAAPIVVKNELWALAHFVIGATPRVYYHCIVVLDNTTYAPKRISVPFLFYSKLIEFCINLSVKNDVITCMFAILDEAPYVATFKIPENSWIQV